MKTAQALSPMYELVFPKVSSQASHGLLMHVAMSVFLPDVPSWCPEGLSCNTHLVGVQVWVAKGLHAASIAKIAHLLEDWETLKSAAWTALQQLAYTHTDTAMYWHLQQMLTEAVNQRNEQADDCTFTEDYF